MITVNKYVSSDEKAWLKCRAVSFLDCSYYNDVKTEKEKYDKPSVCLVAKENGNIVALIDIEIDSNDLTYTDRGRGAVLWHLAVLPEYRRLGVAKKLWNTAKAELLKNGVTYCEVWTQEDAAANAFYQSIGFEQEVTRTWLRCYARQSVINNITDNSQLGQIYGVEELVFDAPITRKAELLQLCTRVTEVRLYTVRL